MDGQKIFVSTVGDDSGDGSEEEPLRTLEKAIDVANEMREDSDKLIEILLREGTYSVTNTIKIINSQKDDSLLKISASFRLYCKTLPAFGLSIIAFVKSESAMFIAERGI